MNAWHLHKHWTVLAGSMLVVWAAAAASPAQVFQINGNLEGEAQWVLDLNGNGVPDVLEGRPGIKGVAFFRLDGVREADIEGNFPDSGPDGFGDAGYSDAPIDCTSCMDDRLLVRSGINTGKLTIVYLADDDGYFVDGDLSEDTSLLYIGFDIFNGISSVIPPGAHGVCDANSSNAGASCLYDDVCVGGLCEGLDTSFHVIDFIEKGDPGVCDDGVADFLDCDDLVPPQSLNCSPALSTDGVPDFLSVPFDVDGDGDPIGISRWDNDPQEAGEPPPPCEPDDPAELDISDEQYRVFLYECAPTDLTLDEWPENAGLPASFGQFWIEVEYAATLIDMKTSSGFVFPAGTTAADFFETYPTDGQDVTTLLAAAIAGQRDVEFLVRHADTLIHAQCARPQVTCSGDIRLDRFKFAQGGLRSFSDANLDGSDEDFITATWAAPIPQLEVSKQIRCVNDGVPGPFEQANLALPGSEIEFEIEIENTGNVPLEVYVDDVLEALGDAGITLTDNVLLSATLYRPSNGTGEPVTPGTAPAQGLNADFFKPGTIPCSFFAGVNAGPGAPVENRRRYLGTLQGVDVCPDPANPVLGDRIVFSYRGTVEYPFQSCEAPLPGLDITNAVTVLGDLEAPDLGGTCPQPAAADGNEITDSAGVVETYNERFKRFCTDTGEACTDDGDCPAGQCLGECSVSGTPCSVNGDCPMGEYCGADDNSIGIDILCRDVDVVKEVRVLPDGVYQTGELNVPTIPTGDTMSIQYRYTASNFSQVKEEVTVADDWLCQDVADTVGATLGACPLCSGANPAPQSATVDAWDGVTLPAPSASWECTVNFASQDALRDFLAQDDAPYSPAGHENCTADDPVGTPDDNCYANCVSMTSNPTDLEEVCFVDNELSRASDVTICNEVCTVTVLKEVRCWDDCIEPTDPEAGWVSDPTVLEMAAGACLEYRLTIVNEKADGTPGPLPICALNFNDLMDEPSAFTVQSPYNVTVTGPGCQELPAEFNWNGVDVSCELDATLDPGAATVVRFRADVASDVNFSLTPTNVIMVECASDCPGGPPNYCCPAESQVSVNPEPCELEVTKEATCDEPRLVNGSLNPAAVWEPSVEALPGGRVGFKIEVCNTGAVDLPRVTLTDQLDALCSDWFVAGSVVADIVDGDGTIHDATSCVCAGGSCGSLAELNGEKNLDACRAGGLLATDMGPDACLVVTFEVEVPDTDTGSFCQNEITVAGETDICSPDGPCAGAGPAAADIQVVVPELDCLKEVCPLASSADCTAQGLWSTDLQLSCDTTDPPFVLTYRMTVTSSGTAPLTSVQICDAAFVQDVLDTPGVNFAGGNPFEIDPLQPDFGCAPVTLVGGVGTVEVRVGVATREAWRCFASTDDDANPVCYSNSAMASAEVDTTDVCAREAETSVVSEPCPADVCVAWCELEVEKEVRCLPDCNPDGLGPEEGWVSDPDTLQVTPGACLQYRIKTKNVSGEQSCPVPVDLCALEFDDDMTNLVNFTAGSPYDVQTSGPSVCDPAFASAFGWEDATVAVCELVQPGNPGQPRALGPGEELTVLFRADLLGVGVLPNPNDDPVNTVTVRGAGDCSGGSPVYCCEDSASVGTEILVPSLQCLSKQWQYEWDENADGVPDGPFSAPSDLIDLSDKVFPVMLKLTVQAKNDGEVPLRVRVTDQELENCIASSADIDYANVFIIEPREGGNGTCNSTASGGDTQLVAVGAAATAGQELVGPGANAVLNSIKGGDDVVLGCELGDERLLGPNESGEWVCYILVNSASAMRAMDACDHGGTPEDGFYDNTASASGTLTGEGSDICVPPDTVVPGDDVACSARIVVPEPCELDLLKEVKCADADDSTYGPTVQGLPGEPLTFRISITNSGPVPIPRLCIKDTISCPTWLPNPLNAVAVITDAGGSFTDDVTADFAGFALNTASPQCFVFASRPSLPGNPPPWLAPGEILEITFNVTPPGTGITPGADPDCTNTVNLVEGYTDVLPTSPASCSVGVPFSPDYQAEIDVLVPGLDCDKLVCADFAPFGGCDTLYEQFLTIISGDVSYPARFTYQFTASNIGETDLTGSSTPPPAGVQICDTEFVQDVLDAAGVVFVPGECALDTDPLSTTFGCVDVGDLAAGGMPATVTCTIEVDDQEAWNAFAPRDGNNCQAPPPEAQDLCYDNRATTTAWVSVAPEVCQPATPQELTSQCSGRVTVGPEPCTPPPCPPHTKLMFDIWNQNEVRFSGTERCIWSWDENLLSSYPAPNHFLPEWLQTTKGRARLNGVGSTVVCGQDAVDAPLLAVAAKMLEFSGDRELAGINLGAEGYEDGLVLFPVGTPPPPPPEDPPDGISVGAEPDYPEPINGKILPWREPGGLGGQDGSTGPQRYSLDSEPAGDAMANSPRLDSRAQMSTKGSLLVFPKVEIKWNAQGRLIQDTFIDITNDYQYPVDVQMYFVDGDMCIWADNKITLTGNEPTYWSAFTGEPKGVSPFTVLNDGCPDEDDPTNTGGRRLRGYILAWAVDSTSGEEIRWNHLKGDALIVRYDQGASWEYGAWAFQTTTVAHGQPTGTPGELHLDGYEYDQCPDYLLLDFYAPGAVLSSDTAHSVTVGDTDLTVWAAIKNLNQ